MNDSRWKRLQDLFHAALKKPPEERQAFLQEACGGDDEMLREVRSLLDSQDRVSDRVDSPIRSMFDMAAEDLEPAPERIGPYRILDPPLGRGGLATVYMAERDDEYRMRVAIKLVRRGMDTEDMLHRLRQERQILANLDHPHIARLLDGGSTEDGRPYVVMEHIEGEHADVYCDRQRLDVRGRIALFVKICEAVSYAHRHLVVHRDIKPSNILVTQEGVPKLLDFGIAKLLKPEQSPLSLALTRPGTTPMTPEYASPEQVRSQPLGTPTDIYSLGVLLYRLLTGHPPYRLTDRNSPEIVRVICDTEPMRPSDIVRRPTTVRTEGDTETLELPERLTALRRATPEQLRRQLTGDLDNIILMALRKEPQRRYRSVDQLIEDLQNHLAQRPVRARPDTFGYRLSKFTSRNRGRLVAATAIAATIIGLSAFYTVQLRQESEIARQERDRAQKEAALSQAFMTTFEKLLSQSSPLLSGGEDKTISQILDELPPELEEAFGNDPPIHAELLRGIGRIRLNRQEFGAAAELLSHSTEIQQLLPKADPARYLDSLNMLTRARFELDANADQAQDAARRTNAKSLAFAKKICPAHASLILDLQPEEPLGEEVFQALVGHLQYLASSAPGVPRTLAAWIESCTVPQVQLIAETLLNQVALDQFQIPDPDHAVHLYHGLLALHQLLVPPHQERIAVLRHNIGNALYDLGRLAEAEKQLRQALEIIEALYQGSSLDIPFKEKNLADVLFARGKYGEAEDYQRSAIDHWLRLAPKHPYIPRTRAVLARTLRAMDRWEEAEALYLQALDDLSEGSIKVLVLVDYGDGLLAQGRLQEAAGHLQEGIDISHRLSLPWELDLTKCVMGRVRLAQERPAEARILLRSCQGENDAMEDDADNVPNVLEGMGN